MSQVTPNNQVNNSIPGEELLEWYRGEQAEISHQRAKLEHMRETADIERIPIERDLENAGFRLNGRVDELIGFAAFLVARGIKIEKIGLEK